MTPVGLSPVDPCGPESCEPLPLAGPHHLLAGSDERMSIRAPLREALPSLGRTAGRHRGSGVGCPLRAPRPSAA